MITFTGAEGADLTSTASFAFKGFVTVPSDGNVFNDTTYTSLAPGSTTPLPGRPTVTDFINARTQGWKLGRGNPLLRDTSTIWKQNNLTAGTGIAAEINTSTDVVEDWFYYPSFSTTGLVTMRYKLAVARGISGQDTISNIGDDSLRIMASYNCGRSWQVLASFSQASLTSGAVNNQLNIRTLDINTGAQNVTLAFYVTNNRTQTRTTYRWILDDIDFGSGTDVQAVSLALPISFAGYCGSDPKPITLTVRNNGFSAIDSIPVSYSYNGGPIVRHTFATRLGSLASATVAYPRDKWLIPNTSGLLKVYVSYPGQGATGLANDTATLPLTVASSRALTTGGFISLGSFLSGGWYLTQYRNNIERTGGWASGRIGSTNAAAVQFSTADSASLRNWLISPLYNVTNGMVMRYRAAVLGGAIGDDTLKIMARINCGPWQEVRAFTAASLTAGQISGVLQNFTQNMPVGAGSSIQVGMLATNGGTFQGSAYTWYITGLDYLDQVSSTGGYTSSTQLWAYPNPANTSLTLEVTPQLLHTDGSILNSQGAVIQNFTVSETTTKLDLATLPAGMYSVVLKTPSGTKVKRFLKQ